MTENVGLGCFGLQRYAAEHWTSHILKYIQLAHTELNSDSPLVTQLIRLSARHDALSTTITLPVNENAQGLASNLTNDTWLQNLGAFPRVCDLISRVHTFQKVFSDQQLLEGPGMEAQPQLDYRTMSLISFHRYPGSRLGHHTLLTRRLQLPRCSQVPTSSHHVHWPLID